MTAVALFLCVTLAYVALRSRNYQYDGLRYLIQARDAVDATDLLHPHHLLFTPVLWLIRRLAGALSPAVDPLLAVQFAMAACGAAGIVVFHQLLRETLAERRLHALYASMLLATSYGYWHYATEPEPYVMALVPALMAIVVVLRARNAFRGSPAVLAAALHALAIGLHQMHVFLGAVLIGLALWPMTINPRRQWKFVAVYLGSVIALTAALYGAAAWLAGNASSPAAMLRWATSYAHSGRWGDLTPMSLPYAAGGAFLSVTGKSLAQRLLGGAPWTPGTVVSLGMVAVIGTTICGLLLIGLRNSASLMARSPSVAGYTALAAAAYLPLLVWWEPYNPEFWIALLPALWAGVALVAGDAPWPQQLPAGRLLLPGLLASLAGYNLAFEIAPESRLANNEYYGLTAAVVRTVGQHDIVVVPVPQVTVYGDYFFAIALRRLALHEMPAGPTGFENNCRFVRARIDGVLADGHRVLLAEHEFTPPAANIKQLTKFSREEYARCYAPYQGRLRPSFAYTWLGRSYTMFEIGPPNPG